jgi:GMP synthase-like glutamine amidotransferase
MLFVSMLGEREHYRPEEYQGVCPSGLEKDWVLDWHGPQAAAYGLEMTSIDICRGDPFPPGAGFCGVVLGGTLHVINEDRPWLHDLMRWLRDYRALGRPLLAICGGHQLLSTRFGAGELVGRAEGTLAGTYEVELTERGAGHPLFLDLPRRPRFHFANYLHILPSDAQKNGVLASQPGGPASVLDHGGHWFSCQFHPEARKESWDCYYAGLEPDYVSAYTEQHDGARLMANFFRFSAEPREQVGLVYGDPA